MNKDYKAVAEYYDENQQSEFRMCHVLNKNMPLFLVEKGISFEIQTGSQYSGNDICLIKIPPDRKTREIIAKVEFEIGANQHEWDCELPRHRWQALNLATRKKYGKNFILFIKSSSTFNSLFAIDCNDDFVIKNFGDCPEILNHNLKFETNNEFYRIYWIDVTKHQYIDDPKTKILKNGNICIIEDNSKEDWTNFYSFLWRRFIRK